MTSIRDIPFEDIKKFLVANHQNYTNDDNAYDQAFILLQNKNSIGHTNNIIEWILAYNVLQKNINIPIYTVYNINNMSQEEIINLGKLLNIKLNKIEHKNIKTIKNVLRYLNKLDEKTLIIPDISAIIFNKLSELEIQDIDISKLGYNDIIELLLSHRNKKSIRNFISDHIDMIIIYHGFYFYIDLLFDNEYFTHMLENINIYNKNTFIKIINDNKNKFTNIKTYNTVLKSLKDNDNVVETFFYEEDIKSLIELIKDLLMINEKQLARKIFNTINDLHIRSEDNPYNFELIYYMINNPNIITIIEFMGIEEFLMIYEQSYILNDKFINNKYLLENLVNNKNYDLLIKIQELYVKNEKSMLMPLVKNRNYDLLLNILQI